MVRILKRRKYNNKKMSRVGAWPAYAKRGRHINNKKLSIRASEGGRVARVVKKGTCRYKILRALTILVRFKKNNGA